MKIALIQDWLTGFAGGEQVLLALHEMYPDAPIYTSLYNPEKVPQFAKAVVISSYLQKIPGLKSKHQIAIPLMPAAFESFDLKGFDVIVSVGGGLSKGVITHPGQRHIAYCHTPIRYIWRFGGDERASGGWLKEKVAHSLRIWDVVSAERVDEFYGNSKTVAARIEKVYRQPSKHVYPPINVDRYTVSTEEPGNYFITVGRLVMYKRPDLIIEAFKKTKQQLKIVGNGPDKDALMKLAEDCPWIEFMGRVSDEELKDLYAKARAFVFAAEEDFGIVPVEAMACGRPVIAYGKGGVTESVVEGVTGTFFPEQTAESLASVLETFDEKAYNSADIRKQAELFSTERFKDEMRRIIEFRS
jgi:glycosyltransferase involved in cell wall biosynthesis